jgi:CelD/BcsL family acetyltransferase involved in cellulose biosynthesis
VGLQVRWIGDARALDEIGPAWDALAALDPTPFSLRDWYGAWWEAYGVGRELRVCTVWDADALVALWPLCRRSGRLESMANVESSVCRPLARDAHALGHAAAATAAERYDILEVKRLPEGDPSIEALSHAAHDEGRMQLVEPDITSPIVDTSGTLADYRRDTKSKWHKNMWRLYRKLVREHDAELRLVEAPPDLERELREGFEVESSGWKSQEGLSVLSEPRTQEFYRRLAARFHARGELRTSSIAIDGRMIAWDFGILHRNRLYSPKSGYVEEFGPLAPGLVLELATIERCFETGIEAHELLGTNEPYKLRFSTSERRHRVFRAFPRRPGPALRYAWRRFAPRRVRQAYADRLAPNRGRSRY